MAKDIVDARAVGVSSTPTLFVNGAIVVGSKPYDQLREMVESELRRLVPHGR